MLTKLKWLCLLALPLTGLSSCGKDDLKTITDDEVVTYDPVAVTKTNTTNLYVHYMPWFETKESSGTGSWGSHWTMASKNPEVTDANGQRQIASYFYPKIGPYHSGDKNVLEYHLLLMKYAGIDGVLIDWYGTFAVNDYAMIGENTGQLVEMLGKVGIRFAMVYEDRTTQEAVNAGAAASAETAAKTDMNFLQSKYFGNSLYIKNGNNPLLLVFGPVVLQTASAWTNAFAALNPKPYFLTLWNESADAGANAGGEYAWVVQDQTTLDSFYANKGSLGMAMGCAYPGFKDYYKAGGWGNGLGWTIDYNNTATLEATLQKAKTAGVGNLQLVTWNDFGEGTMIEPTTEFGNAMLEKVRSFAGVSESAAAFDQIYKLYTLRVKHAADSKIQKKLDQAFYYFVSLQTEKATEILSAI